MLRISRINKLIPIPTAVATYVLIVKNFKMKRLNMSSVKVLQQNFKNVNEKIKERFKKSKVR